MFANKRQYSVELFAGRYLRFFVAGCCTLQGDVIWRGLSIGYDRAQGSLVGLIATESAVEFTDQDLLISEVAALSLMMALQLHPDHNNGLASLTVRAFQPPPYPVLVSD